MSQEQGIPKTRTEFRGEEEALSNERKLQDLLDAKNVDPTTIILIEDVIREKTN